jgi:hypothetical protein
MATIDVIAYDCLLNRHDAIHGELAALKADLRTSRIDSDIRANHEGGCPYRDNYDRCRCGLADRVTAARARVTAAIAEPASEKADGR